MKLTVPAGIDFEGIRSTVRLEDVIRADLGAPGKGHRWPCPIHGGDGFNFSVSSDGKHWRCWSCGESGDVVDYIAKRDGVTLAEAARRLDPSAGPKPYRPSSPPAAPEPSPVRLATWHDPDWQSAVDLVVTEAEAALWKPEGRQALGWLRSRGLDDATIRRFRLGFNPMGYETDPVEALGANRRNRPQGLWVCRGVTIPWVAPGAWYSKLDGDPGTRWVGCNVRRLPAGDPAGEPPSPKYLALPGSERGHGYPWPEATAPGEPAIVCEGELDALTAWQEAGHVANVVTFGGAGQKLDRDDARAFLAVCPDWLLLFDQDDAGDGSARELIRREPQRCKRLILPAGVNDLNDLHRAGGSVAAWLRSEWERLGWPWPHQTPTETHPCER